jgi:hypothetical protein
LLLLVYINHTTRLKDNLKINRIVFSRNRNTMSFFPSLSDAAATKQSKHQKQRPQSQPQQPQPAQPQQARPTPTVFVWSKLAGGTKQTLAEKEAEDKRKEEAAEKVSIEKHNQEMKVQREQALRVELARQKRTHEYEAELAKQNLQREISLKKQAAYEASRTREKGYWKDEITYGNVWSDENDRIIPHGLNMKTMKFLQRWLTIWGDKLKEVTTIGDLENAFYNAFVPWLFCEYNDSKYAFEHWELEQERSDDQERSKRVLYPNDETLNRDKYVNLQQWVHESAQHGAQPWVSYPIWIAASHITWSRVWKAMTKESGAFENGLIRIIQGRGPSASFEWVVGLTPYKTIEFEENREKQIKRMKRDADEIWWGR